MADLNAVFPREQEQAMEDYMEKQRQFARQVG